MGVACRCVPGWVFAPWRFHSPAGDSLSSGRGPNARKMDQRFYIWENGAPKAVSLMEWAKWFERFARHVELTQVGQVRVSTIFIGLNHAFFGGPPLLFETMIFGGWFDEHQERYSSVEEARAGHARCVQRVRALRFIPERLQHDTRELYRATTGIYWRAHWRTKRYAQQLANTLDDILRGRL